MSSWSGSDVGVKSYAYQAVKVEFKLGWDFDKINPKWTEAHQKCKTNISLEPNVRQWLNAPVAASLVFFSIPIPSY